MGYIYSLNYSNGKSYIGLTTKSVEHRYDAHRNAAMSNSRLAVHRAWRKHGPPELEVLAIVEDYDLAETEIRAIKVMNTIVPNGYNLGYGGETSPMLNPMVAAKVAKANKGKPSTFKGKTHTDETKRKIAEAKIGGKLTDEHKAKIAAAGIGRVPSDATRAKLSASLSGKKKSAEHRAKLALANMKDPLPIVEAEIVGRGIRNKRLYSTCKSGHELSGDNLIIIQEGKYTKRRCKECSRLRTQKYRLKTSMQ